jgi:hypothetical protein
MHEHAPYLYQLLVEYVSSVAIAAGSLYHVSPLAIGIAYGLLHWIANPVSGGYLTTANILFVGPLRHRTWGDIFGLVAANLAGGATIYLIHAGGGA